MDGYARQFKIGENVQMKIAISIEHPAWAHQFKNIIKKNNLTGETLVLAVDKDGDLDLLDSFGIKYIKLADSTGVTFFQKGFLFAKLCISYTKAIRAFKPDILIGRASPMMAVAAGVLKIPHLIFEDTEVSRFSLMICRIFSTCIITPQMFHDNLGSKQIRLPIYKELFYLHSQEFVPDIQVVRNCGIDITRPYIVLRFISWNASHDIGIRGISDSGKIQFINRLSQLCRVYISSECELPKVLKKYELKVPYQDIHHILYYATIVISEGASMASEAAILGTHSFYLNEIASGTTEEQERRYDLLRVLHDANSRYDNAILESANLLKKPHLWEEGKEKRKRILAEMPNPNEVFLRKMKEIVSKNGMEK